MVDQIRIAVPQRLEGNAVKRPVRYHDQGSRVEQGPQRRDQLVVELAQMRPRRDQQRLAEGPDIGLAELELGELELEEAEQPAHALGRADRTHLDPVATDHEGEHGAAGFVVLEQQRVGGQRGSDRLDRDPGGVERVEVEVAAAQSAGDLDQLLLELPAAAPELVHAAGRNPSAEECLAAALARPFALELGSIELAVAPVELLAEQPHLRFEPAHRAARAPRADRARRDHVGERPRLRVLDPGERVGCAALLHRFQGEPDQALEHRLLVFDERDQQLLAVEVGTQAAEDTTGIPVPLERRGAVTIGLGDLPLDERGAVEQVRQIELLEPAVRLARVATRLAVRADRQLGARQQQLGEDDAWGLAGVEEPVTRAGGFATGVLRSLRLEQHAGAVEVDHRAPRVVPFGVEPAARLAEQRRCRVGLSPLPGGDCGEGGRLRLLVAQLEPRERGPCLLGELGRLGGEIHFEIDLRQVEAAERLVVGVALLAAALDGGAVVLDGARVLAAVEVQIGEVVLGLQRRQRHAMPAAMGAHLGESRLGLGKVAEDDQAHRRVEERRGGRLRIAAVRAKETQRGLVGRQRLPVPVEPMQQVAEVAVEPRHQQWIAAAHEHLARRAGPALGIVVASEQDQGLERAAPGLGSFDLVVAERKSLERALIEHHRFFEATREVANVGEAAEGESARDGIVERRGGVTRRGRGRFGLAKIDAREPQRFLRQLAHARGSRSSADLRRRSTFSLGLRRHAAMIAPRLRYHPPRGETGQ